MLFLMRSTGFWFVAAHSGPLEIFPHDYEALTTFINTNANNLWGSQLLNHFDYNGSAALEPNVRQALVGGICRLLI